MDRGRNIGFISTVVLVSPYSHFSLDSTQAVHNGSDLRRYRLQLSASPHSQKLAEGNMCLCFGCSSSWSGLLA